MSLIDNIERSRVDVRRAFERPDVIICPADRMPADYLTDDIDRFRIYLQILDNGEGYAERIASEIGEYLETIPFIEDVSPVVLSIVPLGLTWTDDMYENLVNSYRDTYGEIKNYMMMVSFRIDGVRTSYELLKLFLILKNTGRYRFDFVTCPVLQWRNVIGPRYYIEIDNSFMTRIGLRNNGGFIDFGSSRLSDTLLGLFYKLDIYKRRETMHDDIRKSVSRYWSRERMKFG